MPFKSKAQARAAFGGYIPGISKREAREWANHTDFSHLPSHVKNNKEKTALYHAYAVGSAQALTRLGLDKQAGVLGSMAGHALGGAALGGTAGGLSAPEGRRLEGTLTGAGLGAAGGAGGALIGKGIGRMLTSGARDAVGNKAEQLIAGKDPSAMAEILKTDPKMQELSAALQKAIANEPKTQLGSGMLGAVGGSGLGMALTPNDTPSDIESDPYQYFQMQQ